MMIPVLFTAVATDPVTCKTIGTGSQLTTVNKTWIIIIVNTIKILMIIMFMCKRKRKIT